MTRHSKKNMSNQIIFQNPQDILMNAPVGFFTTTPDGRYLSVNNTLAQMHGYDSPRHLMDSVFDIAAQIYVDPADQDNLKRLLEKYGKVTNFECRLSHRSGRHFWVSENINVIKDEDGNTLGYQGFNQDITERKQAEEALSQAQKRLQSVIDSMSEGLYIMDREGRIVFSNPTVASILGYSQEELLGSEAHDLFHYHFDEEGYRSTLEECPFFRKVSRGEEYRAEEYFQQKDGQVFPVEVFAAPMQEDEQGGMSVVVFSDITQRMQTEQALRESEEHFRTLFKDTPVSMIIQEPDSGEIIDANPVAWLQYGLSSLDELKNHEFWLEPPYSLADAQAWMRKADQEGTQQFEWCSRKKNGNLLWEQVQLTPIAFLGQTAILVTGIDITTRKQAEDELMFRNVLMKTQLETSPDGILVVDENDKIIFFNQHFADIWGIPDRVMALQSGKIALEYVLPQLTNSDEFVRRIQDLNENRQEKSFEEIALTDGKILERYSSPMFGSNDEYYGRIWYYRNITDRKKIELALSKSQKIMAQAEKLAGLGSWEWDTKNDTWLLSDNWKRIHGYNQTQLTTSELFTIGHPEDIPAIKKAIAGAIEKDEPYDIEFRIIRQDTGEVRYIHTMGKVEYEGTGQPKVLTGAAQDITDRKKAEEEIKNINQQLEKVNAEKDKLFSIISHDLKSPISGIYSTSQLLAQEAGSISQEDISLISAEMLKSSKNALELLNDLMQWARMSQGGMNFSPEKCNLHEIIIQILSTARDLAEKKGIFIKYDIPQDILVLADQPMLSTIVRNLVFNAVKFTNQGGNISITAEKKDSDVEICVQDDGIGMNDIVLSSIFTVDKIKRQLGTDGEKGTGLGLILCKEFVEKHGGKIWVESEPGTGTRVYFTLSRYH
ncbi:PAS domain-containing sensor histidine kinase [Desulfonatronovibrio magnus]|uniref:PAS domain-containing sensor histidine kinase n=1 Tax=Desulfonatronovibrio magnus TaxID=698827 RepID=UPI0005EAEDF8|nr:PAS domain-containing sensor histidine kinase [Desulfonatronovibrio magnus]